MTISFKKIFLFLTFISILSLGVWTYTMAEGSTISVCVNKSGAMYLMGEGFTIKKCEKSDQLLTWNTVGVSGPKGDTGPQGPQGDVGPIGQQGPAGIRGEQGEIGMTGDKGLKGDPGPVGPQGEMGEAGSVSDTYIISETKTSAINLQRNDKLVTEVSCPENATLLSGGGQVSMRTTNPGFTSDGPQSVIVESYPISKTTWKVVGMALSPSAFYVMDISAHVVCTE